MNDVIVSIRLPRSLLKELKAKVKEKHFLDVSEEVRSIIREKWIQYTNPNLFELKKLREGIEKEVKRKSKEKVQEQMNKELERIKEQLKKGELLNG